MADDNNVPPHIPPMQVEPGAAAAQPLLAVVDGHHGQAQPPAAAVAANHNNANGNANHNNQNQNANMTAEEAEAAAVAAITAAYESAPSPPQTAEEVRLTALRERHFRNRQTLAKVLNAINRGRWADLRRILRESEEEDRNQIFAVENLESYVVPLPFTVRMNRRTSTTNMDVDAMMVDDDSDYDDDDNNHEHAIDAEESSDSSGRNEPNAAVIAAANAVARMHALDANVFQACCMSGRNVPVDILRQIVSISEGQALTTATKPPVSYLARYRRRHAVGAGGAGGGVGPDRYMHGETVRREPIDIACINGHANVLKFILDEVGRGGNGGGSASRNNGTKAPTAMTPQQRSKVRALAGGEDPEFDISLLDACFVRQLMPHAFTGMTSGAAQQHAANTNPEANLEFIRYHLQDVLLSLRQMNTEEDMSAPLANTWTKAKMIMDALFCNPAKGRPFPSLVLHKLFSREYDSNILSVIPWLILHLYPDQAKAVDANGNLPLHCFCQNDAGRKLYQFEMAPGTESLLTSEAREMLRIIGPNNTLSTIIQSYPEAALKKNRRGRLPLHEASGNKWFDFEDIERLAKADPEALDVPDPVTGLYPFMMAASHPPVHKTGYDDITKIFILLRESPENVRRIVKKMSEGTKVKSGKVAKREESVANGRHAPVTNQGNRKRSSSSKKRFVDDDFLSGSSDDDDDECGTRQPMKRSYADGMGERFYNSKKKPGAAASSAHSSKGPRSSGKPARKSSASKNGEKKGTSLSWNDDSDDLMDDRDELF